MRPLHKPAEAGWQVAVLGAVVDGEWGDGAGDAEGRFAAGLPGLVRPVRLASPNSSQRKKRVSQAFTKTGQAIYTKQRNRNGRNGDQAKPVCWPFSRSRRHGARDQSRPGDGKRHNARPATLIHRACPELARMEQLIRLDCRQEAVHGHGARRTSWATLEAGRPTLEAGRPQCVGTAPRLSRAGELCYQVSIRSTHWLRHGLASKGSPKYWVSRATFPSRNSIMLTV